MEALKGKAGTWQATYKCQMALGLNTSDDKGHDDNHWDHIIHRLKGGKWKQLFIYEIQAGGYSLT